MATPRPQRHAAHGRPPRHRPAAARRRPNGSRSRSCTTSSPRACRYGDHLPLEAAMVDSTTSAGRRSRSPAAARGPRPDPLEARPGWGPVVGSVQASYLARTATLYFHLAASTYGQLMATQVLRSRSSAQLAAQNPEAAPRPMTPFFEQAPNPIPRGELPGPHLDVPLRGVSPPTATPMASAGHERHHEHRV